MFSDYVYMSIHLYEHKGKYKREYTKVLNLISLGRIEMRRVQGWGRLFMSSLYIFTHFISISYFFT